MLVVLTFRDTPIGPEYYYTNTVEKAMLNMISMNDSEVVWALLKAEKMLKIKFFNLKKDLQIMANILPNTAFI